MPTATRCDTDERCLVGLVADGDEAAFAELYRRHSRQVYAAAHRIVRDRRAAEDVTQEVFASIWMHPGRIDLGRATLRTLLMSMAKYRAIDVVRSETSKRRRHGLAARQPPGWPDLSTTDVADVVSEADSRARRAGALRQAVDKLPEPQRTSVELAYFGGHTFCEVARLTGVPEGTAKSRLTSALRRLERQLATVVHEGERPAVTADRRAN